MAGIPARQIPAPHRLAIVGRLPLTVAGVAAVETESVKYMDPEEFRQFGYLQELNRMFLHPLGLALEVVTDDSGKAVAFGGVWDYRDDPEGMRYGTVDIEKTSRVATEWQERTSARQERLGYMMQPPDEWHAIDIEEPE